MTIRFSPYSKVISCLFAYTNCFKLAILFYTLTLILTKEDLTLKSRIRLTVCKLPPTLFTPLNSTFLSDDDYSPILLTNYTLFYSSLA